ncbi:MAG: short-chain dehydrogenase [Gammaproteobacteria bacterium]|nr:MAG: short-chain dehydrogenase [Gammaproteobacteria bacterium]
MAEVNTKGILAGKVAVVTGASRGIGEAVAIRLAMEGAKVTIAARTIDPEDHFLPGTIIDVANRIEEAGGRAIAIKTDLSREEDRENLIRGTEEAFGPVDILVNNAAVTYFMPVVDFTKRRYDTMFEVQVYAPFHLSQLVLPGMIEKQSGWIVNISSHAAIHPNPTMSVLGKGGTVYGTCKAALERFTTGLASEVYNDNIAVNVISPGLVATPGVVHHKLINKQNEAFATPVEHMAQACLKLCSVDAQEMTGQIQYCDQVMKKYQLEASDLI